MQCKVYRQYTTGICEKAAHKHKSILLLNEPSLRISASYGLIENRIDDVLHNVWHTICSGYFSSRLMEVLVWQEHAIFELKGILETF